MHNELHSVSFVFQIVFKLSSLFGVVTKLSQGDDTSPCGHLLCGYSNSEPLHLPIKKCFKMHKPAKFLKEKGWKLPYPICFLNPFRQDCSWLSQRCFLYWSDKMEFGCLRGQILHLLANTQKEECEVGIEDGMQLISTVVCQRPQIAISCQSQHQKEAILPKYVASPQSQNKKQDLEHFKKDM